MPERIQRRREKGWQMPPNTVYVGRPTRWGNPFPTTGDWIMWTAVGLGYRGDAMGRLQAAVTLYRAWMADTPIVIPVLLADEGAIEWSDGSMTTIGDHVRGFALAASGLCPAPVLPARPDLAALRGRDLACWCGDGPCHADVLLELANG